MKGIGVNRVDILQFAINVDKSPFLTNSNLSEKAEDNNGSGTGGGGGNNGGGGGPTTTTGGTTGSGAPARMDSGVPMTQPAQEGGPPRFDFRPGASIEDFFRNDYRLFVNYVWKFEMTTELQTEIKNQPVKTLDELEGVINGVLQT
jgi:hypothetical protein